MTEHTAPADGGASTGRRASRGSAGRGVLLFLRDVVVIVAAALIVFGATRFDVLAARWREAFGSPPPPREAPPAPRPTAAQGFKPHAAPVHKPAFHRSGKRH